MKIISIIKETVIWDNENNDKLFFDYCDEYSIEYKIIKENLKPDAYPDIEFKSGPVSLNNMLKERFGYTEEEINADFPQIINALKEDMSN